MNMKGLGFGMAAMLVVLSTAGAALVEDFESYNTGSFVAQTTAWTGDDAWEIVDDGTGNKVLSLPLSSADKPLMYVPETFSADGEGYRMQFKMYAVGSGTWASKYSGILCDANATTPTGADYSHRFYIDGGGTFADLHGDWSHNCNYTTYVMIERVGDNVEVWMSGSVINPNDPGTSIIDGDAPSLAHGGNSFGLYGVGHVLYDDITVGAIPEPATMSLLAAGGLGILIRRKR